MRPTIAETATSRDDGRAVRREAIGIEFAAAPVMAKSLMKTKGNARSEPQVGAKIGRAIIRIRGQNVMLDADLAELYGVAVKVLNQAVRRNISRFPADFMFQLAPREADSLRSQIVTLNVSQGRTSSGSALRSQFVTSNGRGGRRYRPYAFTEQGVAMLSSVLRSPKAIAVNIEVMRAFVQLRRLLDSNAGLARKLEELERKYDGQFKVVFDAIRALMTPSGKSRRLIGFRPRADKITVAP